MSQNQRENQPSSDDQSDNFVAPVRQRFGIEYSALEVLLIALIDASPPQQDSRRLRLKQAMKAIAGHCQKFVDLPDSKTARALLEMSQHQGTKRRTHSLHSEEPYEELSSDRELARTVGAKYGITSDSEVEALRKKFAGTYDASLSPEDQLLYARIPMVRASMHDEEQESQMLADFKAIEAILSRYGVQLALERPFWRTLAKTEKELPTRV